MNEAFKYIKINHGIDTEMSYPYEAKVRYGTYKVKSCYNPLKLGTVIVLVSSGIEFVYSTFV